MSRFRFWMVGIFFGSLISAAGVPPANVPATPETVVLLHGLGLRGWAMGRLEAGLAREGYRVINLTYPSRTMPLEQLAGEWLPAQLSQHGVAEATRLHFVTHSMGGIVVRMWLRAQGAPSNLGRVVMLAPPNGGSAVADRMKKFAPFRAYLGLNGSRLGTDDASIPRSLGPWPAGAGELGVIAGDRSINPLFSAWLQEPNDGAVAVTTTRLAGMSDFIVLHHSHTMLPWRGETLRCVWAFLRDGRFPKEEISVPPAVSSPR